MYSPSLTPSAAPVFLSAPGPVMCLIRQALAAHPRFFTSHLPCDCRELIEEWAGSVTRLATSRRPVWLSDAAFQCVGMLERALPGVRFVKVQPQQVEVAEAAGCLSLDTQAVLDDPPSALARILAFLGEEPAPLGRLAA